MYWVSEWSAVRRDEVIDLPDALSIHPDFWGGDREGFERGHCGAAFQIRLSIDDPGEYLALVNLGEARR